MRITKPVAGLLLSVSLVGTAHAQSLRSGSTPAEFPPASYTGNQYVDSKGCVYIRAGIDGNVTWVPRVSRDRKLVCGYKPTATATTAQTAPTAPTQRVEQITLAPEDAAPAASAPPAATASAAPTTTAAASTPPKDPLLSLFGITPSTRTPSPSPPPTVFPSTRTEETAAPTTTARVAAPAPRPAPVTVYQAPPSAPPPRTTPTTTSTARVASQPVAPATTATATTAGPCPGASALSNQYFANGNPKGVRCGPQAESPITRGPLVYSRTDAASLPPGTRVVPLHVWQQRANATNLPVPEGYRPVWEDDRLNPHRAERTLAPATQRAAVVPQGYRRAWDDDRLNPMRGVTTVTGNAQTATIWQDGVPRKIILPPGTRVVRVPKNRVQSADTVTRLDTSAGYNASVAKAPAAQSAATSQAPKAIAAAYVRVGAFGSDADARRAAKQLARQSGLTVRLGTAKKGNQTYKLVLAGPYTDTASAQAALQKVRGAGYSGARMLR